MTAPKVQAIVIARESDESNNLLMEGMIERSCSVRPDLPGGEEMRSAGMDPFFNPTRWGTRVEKSGGNRWVLAMREGTLFFYWMGSAASLSSDDGENRFTTTLVQVLRRFAPKDIYVAAFTRLVRSATVSGDLFKAVVDLDITINYPGGSIRPSTPAGEAQWMLHSMFASMERNEIVTRNLIGQIALVMRGGVTFGERSLPVGYVMVDKRVVPDPTLQPVVERVLKVLADPSLSYNDAAKWMGEMGVERVVLATGESVNFADLRHPATAIKGLLKWVDMYETGVWTMVRNNPLRGVDKVGPLEVRRANPGDQGVLHIDHCWGVPEGGWASPMVFAAIRDRIRQDEERKRKGGGSSGPRRRKPLSAVCGWTDESHDWFLDTELHKGYRLRKRKSGSVKGPRSGWHDSTSTKDVVGRYACLDLHRALVEAAVAALEAGVPGDFQNGFLIETERSFSMIQADTASVLADFDARIKEADQMCKRARDNANRAKDASLAAQYVADSEREFQRANDLRRQRDAAASSVGRQVHEPVVRSDADHVAKVLAQMAAVDGPVDGALNAALRHVLLDLRFSNVTAAGADFEFCLQLPFEAGLVRLGPIVGSVKDKGPKRRPPTRRAVPLTDDERRQVVADYVAGKPVIGTGSICGRFKLSTNAVYRILDEEGVPRRVPRNRSRKAT